MNPEVFITEVGPRDGLQNEPHHLETSTKITLVESLYEAGIQSIELGSFVSPKAVPAMADTDDLTSHFKGAATFKKLGLVMNQKGFDRAIESGVDGVCIVVVVSDTLSQKNNRKSVPDAIFLAQNLMKQAHDLDLFVRVDVATAWVCPYEGHIPKQNVTPVIEQLWEYHPDELALCDTIGQATPDRVRELFDLLGQRFEMNRLAAHFHDTNALGIANAYAALQAGVRRFDASIGGLGGCPFAPGAKGNLATEDLVHLCHSIGLQTGVDWQKLWPIVDFISEQVKRPLGGNSKSWYLAQRKDCI